VDKELLEQHGRGLIALSGCIAGEVPELLLAGNYEEARAVAGYFREFLVRTTFPRGPRSRFERTAGG